MDELRLLIKSRYPIVTVETQEEGRLETLLASVCETLGQALFTWSVTDGIRRRGLDKPVYQTQEPAAALKHIHTARLPAVYLLRDFHPFLKEAPLVRLLREIAQASVEIHATIVFSSPSLDLPPELNNLSARYELTLPGEDEIRRAVMDTFRGLTHDGQLRYSLTDPELRQFAINLKGLTLAEVRRVISKCVFDDDALDAADLPTALEAKKAQVERSGVLEFIDTSGMASLGGLKGLKGWLDKFRAGFGERAREMGLRPPRGVMLVGVQGCGKSLAAKTIAREWQLPLLKLDTGRLMDKYIGESEKNLRHAYELAEATAPVVLWIDEIEKAFAGATSSDADAGLGRRLFGSFLTWLQEKKETVFVTATANDLSSTPPELLRKGRFDEVFFVDLPDADERREILSIHFGMRKQDARSFDLDALVDTADGFSGAEIEQAIVASLYGLLAEGGKQLTTEHILEELQRTVPLSVSRKEYVQQLQAMAAERFVPAK